MHLPTPRASDPASDPAEPNKQSRNFGGFLPVYTPARGPRPLIWGTLLFVRVYMVTSTSHAKKTKGTCASFGRDLSSTIQRYDLILESPTQGFWEHEKNRLPNTF